MLMMCALQVAGNLNVTCYVSDLLGFVCSVDKTVPLYGIELLGYAGE